MRPISDGGSLPKGASHIRKRLIETWIAFSGNVSDENAERLHDARLAAELLLAEVQA